MGLVVRFGRGLERLQDPVELRLQRLDVPSQLVPARSHDGSARPGRSRGWCWGPGSAPAGWPAAAWARRPSRRRGWQGRTRGPSTSSSSARTSRSCAESGPSPSAPAATRRSGPSASGCGRSSRAAPRGRPAARLRTRTDQRAAHAPTRPPRLALPGRRLPELMGVEAGLGGYNGLRITQRFPGFLQPPCRFFRPSLEPLSGPSKKGWRRGWDPNPRYPCGYNGFRVHLGCAEDSRTVGSARSASSDRGG